MHAKRSQRFDLFVLLFIFYLHLKMALERSKRCDVLASILMTKSISKKLLINYIAYEL